MTLDSSEYSFTLDSAITRKVITVLMSHDIATRLGGA